MDFKGPIIVGELMDSMIRKCSAKYYNKQIDESLKSFACGGTMHLVEGFAKYSSLKNIPQLELLKEKAAAPDSPEAVKYVFHKISLFVQEIVLDLLQEEYCR